MFLGLVSCFFIYYLVWDKSKANYNLIEMQTGDQNLITKEQAEKIAGCELNAFEKANKTYKNAILEESSIDFYDMNGNPSAFLFQVRINEGYIGHITISATKDFFPMLETVINKEPETMGYRDAAIKPAKEKCRKMLANSSQYTNLIYETGQEYLLRCSYPFLNFNVSLVSGKIVSEKYLKNLDEIRNSKKIEIQNQASVFWKNYTGECK